MTGHSSPLHPALAHRASHPALARQNSSSHFPSRPTSPFVPRPEHPSRPTSPFVPRTEHPLLIGKVKAELRPGVRNILVTGGAGFIGSWVLRHLVVQHPEYHLVCASALLLFKLLSELMTDNLDYSATLRNLANVQDYANFSFHHGDITDPTSVRGALRKYNIDCVLHFAAHSHVDLSFGNSFTFTHTNTFGTHVLLEASKEAAVGLFLHVSTDEVYGEVADGAADLLETAILAPTNPYAASKACAEMLVNAYRKSFKLPVVIVRSNNVYGPQQYPEKVIPKFISLLNRQQRLILHGDGSPTRRYLYGADAADAIDIVLARGVIGQVYNIGSADEISNLDLCRQLLREYGLPAATEEDLRRHIEFTRDRPYNDHRYAVDGSKLRALGWEQATPFVQGLRQTIDWYRAYGESWWGDITPLLSAFPVVEEEAVRVEANSGA